MAQPNVSMRAASLLSACLLCLSACSSRPAESPDERLRRQAAQDAAQVHHDVKQAGKEARQAISAAGRETRDIVAGARQGWREGAAKDGPIVDRAPGSSGSRLVDINHASAAELEQLPGIHGETARRIVEGRPYKTPSDLSRQGLVTRAEYSRIAPNLTAR